jgi:hypothetical protein
MSLTIYWVVVALNFCLCAAAFGLRRRKLRYGECAFDQAMDVGLPALLFVIAGPYFWIIAGMFAAAVGIPVALGYLARLAFVGAGALVVCCARRVTGATS